ncbi:WXG100 family type VII secretion target [Actinoplanes sp. NPDC049265]|uniref:WXG100 family type VII secretion target n=1 Tax=Actinoplanes sp. NPDC049265 TaxID=3363902 RepID=UPI00371E223F
MPNYSYAPAVGDDGVQSLRAVTEKLRASLEALTASAERFKALNAGHAINSYDEAQLMWNQGMAEMQDALGVKGQNLGRIGEGYVLTDAHGAAMFQR